MSNYSPARYIGTGAQTAFNIPWPYLDVTHLVVRVNGATASYTMPNSYTVNIAPAPASGAVVEILRLTSGDQLVNFTAGVILSTDLQYAYLQGLYRADEALTFGQILPAYTFATLPAVGAVGAMIYCTDAGAKGSVLVSDGVRWTAAGDLGPRTVSSDADFTPTNLGSATTIRLTGTITANRTVTLNGTNAYKGLCYRFTRTGAGAFNWSINGLKNLAVNTWCDVEYDGAAWFLSAYGTL